MARIRTVKPEFWDDEKLANISRDARLLFIGMWNQSDDFGVVKGHSRWLQHQIFPYDDIKTSEFDQWLIELESISRIISFTNEGEKYYYIKHFLEHQRVDRPNEKSRNPIPSDDVLNDTGIFYEYSTNNRRTIDDVSLQEGKGRERNNTPLTPQRGNGLFEKFWDEYPRKVGKKPSKEKFSRLKVNTELLNTMLRSIARQRASPQWKAGKIPNPETWLNQERWNDEFPEPEKDRWDV